MNQGSDEYWRVPRPQRLLWAEWNTDYSVFNGNTGETHLLSELPAEVLRQLSRGPVSQAALTSTLAGLCEVEGTSGWSEKIADLLEELADLELIEPMAP